MNLLMSEEERSLFHILWDRLEVRDQISLEPELILEYVRASMRARRELTFAAEVPEILFCEYVLPIRVNNEYPDGSRGWLCEKLTERVQGKSILEAALEVNFWCFEQATYQSTDDRTISPRGMCRRTMGRCGEESTLLVSALRAVGIPARQVYVPYWSHCDDNHAWVEFWAGDGWHFMGACEPEPVPDVGWFQSAASRAMLVRSRIPDHGTGIRIVNSTALYADTCVLNVAVRKDGKYVPDTRVRFQIINESRLVTLHSELTDESGQVSLETGFGSLIVSSFFDGRLVEQQVDLRNDRDIVLDWEDGFDPLTEERCSVWELVPPTEKLQPYYEPDPAHQERLRHCENMRRAYQATFSSENHWLELAKGNRQEIGRFLNLPGYASEDKEALLSTLSEKDFADTACDVLEDYLSESLRWKHCYSRDVWLNSILSPRVEHEALLPVRSKIRQILEREALKSENQVRDWMKHHIRHIPEFGLTDRCGNAAKYVQHRICPKSEWDILAVQICRALGIASSIDGESCKSFGLTIIAEEPLRWRENYSIARWADGAYHLLSQPKERLEPGSYSLVTSRRQIDGTVSARELRFVLNRDREVEARFQPDQTKDKLKSVPLTAPQDRPSLLLFLQPGAEPTEHLLLELSELKEELNAGQWSLRLLAERSEQAENDMFQKVLSELRYSDWDVFDSKEHYRIQTSMSIGDARLPLAVVLDSKGCGVYACANYNIRTGQRLLQILKMIQ